jgi:MarR family transcriptional regulator, negative regulator of the multidrug operon emrRAB
MPLSQIAHVERNLRGIAARSPEWPLTESLILRLILMLGRDLTSHLDGMLKPAGLGEPEYRLLAALFSADGSACAGELCAALGQSPANLTRIGDGLVKRGYVSRIPHTQDRRRIVLTLRPAGTRLLQSMLPRIGANVACAFDGFTAAEKKKLLATLKKLLAGVDAVGVRSRPTPRMARRK